MTTSTGTGAGALLQTIGLLPDGPVLWGRPVASRKPGIYVVELAAPLASAPIDISRIGTWIDRVEGLRLDGERPSGKALAARLGSFWIPSATVLYAAGSSVSIGGRVTALIHHVLGDRRPHADGQWLHALRGMERARIWWAETSAPEEYLDAFLDAFASAVPAAERDALPDPAIALPWAIVRAPSGHRRHHGITGAVLPDDRPAQASQRVTEVAAGAAVGAGRTPTRGGKVRALKPLPRLTRGPSAVDSATPRRRTGTRAPAAPPASRTEPVHLTGEAIDRLKLELEELTRVRRPDVIARIKSARELGDLRENAEYQASREEQSFLEGRIRLIEERLRYASVIEGGGTPHVDLGSTVTVEIDGEAVVYALVGTTEADPVNGRLSSASPVGAALMGHRVGDAVEVRTPRGSVVYRIIALE